MRKKIVLLLVLGGSGLLLAGGETTLKEAVSRALERDGALGNARLEVRAAETARTSAEKSKWFTLQAGGNYRYTSETMEITADAFPFPTGIPGGQGTVLASAPAHTVDLKLGLAQPLYLGGLLANQVRAESARRQAEEWTVRQRTLDVAGMVKSSYYTWQLLGKKSASLELLRSSLELHEKRIGQLVKEELVRKTDLLETRSKIIEIDLSMTELRQQQAAEAIQFRRLTGLEPGDIQAGYREEVPDLETALSRLAAGHPLLKSLEEKSRQVEMQKKIVASAYLPQVSGYAEFHYGRPGLNYFKDEWTPYFVGGLNLSFSVFNWNRKGRDQKLLDLGLEKIANQRSDFLLNGERGLRQLYAQKEAVAAKRKLLDELIGLADEEVRLKERLYSERQLDHLTYLQAETSRERCRSQRDELEMQESMLHAAIQNLMGIGQEES